MWIENGFRSSPSNLLQHLSGAHLISALKSSESSSTTKISSFFNRSKASQIKKYKRDHPTQKKFKDMVVKWIVKRKRPFSIVEDPEFIDMVTIIKRGLFGFLNSNFLVPVLLWFVGHPVNLSILKNPLPHSGSTIRMQAIATQT